MTLMSVRVYYVTCDVITSGFASFPATPTGAEPSSLVAVAGVCVDGATTAEGRRTPRAHCKADGSWLLVAGGCQCAPGYQPSDQLHNVCTSTHAFYSNLTYVQYAHAYSSRSDVMFFGFKKKFIPQVMLPSLSNSATFSWSNTSTKFGDYSWTCSPVMSHLLCEDFVIL